MVALVCFLSVVVAAVAMLVGARLEAGTAADGAALAAVVAAVDGESPALAAQRVAAANGTRVSLCRCPRFNGRGFAATVSVVSGVAVPLWGVVTIEVTRSAEYAIGPP